MHSSLPTLKSNDVSDNFSLDIGDVTEKDTNIPAGGGSSSRNIEKLDKRTFHERFEAEKISRCNCGRRACSHTL